MPKSFIDLSTWRCSYILLTKSSARAPKLRSSSSGSLGVCCVSLSLAPKWKTLVPFAAGGADGGVLASPLRLPKTDSSFSLSPPGVRGWRFISSRINNDRQESTRTPSMAKNFLLAIEGYTALTRSPEPLCGHHRSGGMAVGPRPLTSVLS